MKDADKNENEKYLKLRGGIKIYPSQIEAIKKLVAELKKRCPAQFILLADTSGLFILDEGDKGSMDLTALSSLVAGDMAASMEIAKRTGVYKNFQLILREGQNISSFIAEAGDNLLLFVQVVSDTPLGWARLLIKEAGRQIAEIMETAPEQVEELDLGLDKEKLSSAIEGAFDSMWMG